MWYNGCTSAERSFFACLIYAKMTRVKGAASWRRVSLQLRVREIIIGQDPKIISGGAIMRVKITMACSECKQRNYDSKKNKKNDPDRLEMMKYCRFCRKHTLHKETK